MKNNILSFIVESVAKTKEQRKEFPFGNGYAFIKDALPKNIDFEYVLKSVQDEVPHSLLSLVDSIIVGDFEEFRDRQINAMYKDGAVYVSNIQTDNDDMIDDIVHEVAHAVEQEYGFEIYSDESKIVQEFVQKRKKLKSMLEANGIQTQGYDFDNVEYDKDFDDYLFKTVGYPILSNMVVGLFPDAYSATSVSEYFASGFEMYFLKDRDYLKKVSPKLYRKITEILKDV